MFNFANKSEITEDIVENSNEMQHAQRSEKNFEASQKNIGIDLGYGYVKLIDSVGEIKFPSIVGIGRELQYSSSLKFAKENVETKNIAVKVDKESYFVGELALRQSDIASRSLNLQKVNDNNSKILMLTSVGMLNKWDNESFNIVTGLPINQFSEQRDWADKLVGHHEVTFVGDRTEKVKNFSIKKVHIIPQPFGTLYDQMLNNSGGVINKDLADMMIGVIDVGYKTTGFAAINQVELVEHLSFSNTTALSSAYRMIANYFRKEYGIDKEVFELDEILESGWLKLAGKNQDITYIKNEVYEKIANKIVLDINSLWNYRDFDVIFMTGGGGQALSSFILKNFPNMKLVEGSQHANVRGYQKLANNIFRS
ncbi:MAG: hypothetical protein APF76_18010 [Desulfitibacter sp. BRH_c19]|nr:MAG: hypothetical protein APF76_18010 [Desulfitibacter sp. BRH_c19]